MSYGQSWNSERRAFFKRFALPPTFTIPTIQTTLMKIAPCHALALLLAGVSLAHAQDGATRTIALRGTPAPGLGGNFDLLRDPILNGSGVVAFFGTSVADDGALYETVGTGLVAIATTLQAAPAGGGNFSGFQTFALNESGTVAFSGDRKSVV